MRKLLSILLTISLAAPLWSWDKGFNFRATSGYVTDGTDETYVADQGDGAAETYPKTRNSVTFGWDTSGSSSDRPGGIRDRNSANDRRVAGVQFGCASGVNPCKFKVDLPAAGDYDIYLALGDPSGGANNVSSKIYDNTTLLATIGPTTNASGQFVDAGGTNRTSASDWVTNGSVVKLTKTFATTTFFISIEDVTLGPMTHLRLVQATAATTAVSPSMNMLGIGGSF